MGVSNEKRCKMGIHYISLNITQEGKGSGKGFRLRPMLSIVAPSVLTVGSLPTYIYIYIYI